MVPSFVSEAPARICFFGEHQDYLGLPVIACAVPLHCRLQIRVDRDSRILRLRVPKLGKIQDYHLDALPPRQSSDIASSASTTDNVPDFALAAIHEAIDDGWELVGADCMSETLFPMQAGISSSSAFCVAFCHALAHMAGKTPLYPLEIAKLAHRAEVTHFGAPGGTMDHISSAVGGMLRIGPGQWDVRKLMTWQSPPPLSSFDSDAHLGVWVLAYSGEPKDTLKHLHRCKNARLALLEKLGGTWDMDPAAIPSLSLSADEQQLLNATLTNRDLERQAFALWETKNIFSAPAIAALMEQHHHALRDGLLLSTPRLEAMYQAAQAAGAWGFKVVGSGGGGCGVAWASVEMGHAVATAMKSSGATETWIFPAEPTDGAKIYTNDSNAGRR
ncbi:hypothetical protein ACA910_019428 [Epithemia clementina (nom. ined.)]